MKVVIYYNEESTLTHLSTKEVDDNYTLKSGEVWELPNGFLTPAKLVNGIITSATQEESDAAAAEYLKKNNDDIEKQPTIEQRAFAMMSSQIAKLNQQITGLTSLVQAQQQTITKLKGGN